ncbi:MAG: RNA repair domain-containing protein [Candidatus Nanoarchaeia archaeon]|nr:RNA repair domain-containing protein [Candidatus Nanoarchaeia archaeon]MDD5239502.1 RNA repair domain-containing protein [Candidatus Nanoarchaeia archaeon]
MDTWAIDTLLRAVYDENFAKLKDFIVVIRHRGAENDRKEIDGERITKVQKDGFFYLNRHEEKIFIPAHRILELKRK